jgi:AcrR family transcriptional regulator
MPTPPRTSLPEIVAAGRSILEADGLGGLTMQRVAEEVGVRSPSLYKRVRSRGDLIGLIADSVADDLAATMDAAASDDDPEDDLRAIANAFRAFALAHPNGYALVFARLPEDARIDPERNARAAATLLRTAGRLAGPDDALAAARTVTAWAHGFVTMELAGAFRLGGDVDRAFAYGVDHLAGALESSGARLPHVNARRSQGHSEAR